MAARPSYDPELLLALKMAHPEWDDAQVAAALSEDNRARGRSGVVTPSMIQSAVYRNRSRWEALGFTLPRKARKSRYVRELMELRGFKTLTTEENTRNLALKRLRQCERLHEGLAVPHEEASKARTWEAEMRLSRTVVDINTEDGHAYIREANSWELDDRGNLIDLTARAEPEQTEVGLAGLKPDMTDPAEAAIWNKDEMSELDRLRIIAEYRTVRLSGALDAESDTPASQKVQNGSPAG
jgi:hypothetical protein